MALAAMTDAASILPTLCRDCFTLAAAPRGQRICPRCGGLRLVQHPELDALAIAHVDCDAFYASVEKRDRPDLAERPVIVGGGARGVVATACYRARLSGVKSAMPMYKALALCPDAVVIAPDFAKYASAARAIRARMRELSPLVEPLSIDEAVLDLRDPGTCRGVPAAVALARFARAIECDLGITVSVGLAPNRLLAKIAVERDKPRGFAVIGQRDAAAVLAPLPVRTLPGVGPALERRLTAHGITRLGDLQALSGPAQRALGRDAAVLMQRALGKDSRPVIVARSARSISVERTLESDIADADALLRLLAPMAEHLAHRLKERELMAEGLGLKLRTSAFDTRTRHVRLVPATSRATSLFSAARTLLLDEANGTTLFRLVGLSAEPLTQAFVMAGDLADRAAAALTRDTPLSGGA